MFLVHLYVCNNHETLLAANNYQTWNLGVLSVVRSVTGWLLLHLGDCGNLSYLMKKNPVCLTSADMYNLKCRQI
jgi:hypothetical protein